MVSSLNSMLLCSLGVFRDLVPSCRAPGRPRPCLRLRGGARPRRAQVDRRRRAAWCVNHDGTGIEERVALGDATIRRMNLLIRITLVALMAAVAGGVRTGAQAPNSAQAQRNQLANQPAPRTSDGRIVIGNTATLKGVWIGGNLGFCNANTVAAPASLNPGAAGARGAGPGGAGAPAGAGGPTRRQGPWRRRTMHSGPLHVLDPCRLE